MAEMAGTNATFSSKDVPVDHMDYNYIEKCSSEKELARILRALRSGREGYYPNLIEFCENKLRSINPDHRVLRKQQPILKAWDLGHDDLTDLNKDMEHWTSHMKTMEEEAIEKNMFESNLQEGHVNGFLDRGDLPPVRRSKTLKGSTGKAVSDGKSANPDRIKSSDYKAWDKFDVDQECEKIDQEESTPVPGPKTVNISRNIDSSSLSDDEKKIKAVKEKEKGNEAFKSGDYEEALSYYCRSICLHPIAASYNNRALVYLRLQKWKDAVNDCNTVLLFDGESGNLKALLRRATAYKSLKRYDDATSDICFVLEKEPNNARAKGILDDIKKIQSRQPEEASSSMADQPVEKKGKKMVITEVEGESSDESESSPRTEDGSPSSLQCSVKKNVTDKKDVIANVKVASEPVETVKITPEDANNSTENSGQTTPKIELKKDVATVTEPTMQLVDPVFPPKTAQHKAEATQFFKAGRYGEACESYSKAITSLSSFLKQDNGQECYKIAFAVLHNNRAACRLKQGDDKACIEDCNKVLEIKLWDAKAFMRRASAYEHVEKYANAWADYQMAYSMDRQNTFAQNGANRMSNHLREVYGGNWREKVPKVAAYPYQSMTNMSNTVTPPTQQTVHPTLEEVAPKTDKDSKSNAVAESVEQKELPKVESDNVDKPSKKHSPSKEGKKKQKNKKRNKSKSKSPQRIETPAPTVDEEEKENKRRKIRQDLFQKLKTEGNDFVKSGKYNEAIENYTRCLSLCPKEPASYTNRALCFLKLKKHVSAINDCMEAIKLDPCNVKAYYRLAQARKAEGYHNDALRDIKKLLDIDPGNKAAQSELVNLKKLTQQSEVAETESMPQVVRKKQMIIEEVDSSDSSDEGEFVLPNENFQSTEDQPKIHEEPKQKKSHTTIGNDTEVSAEQPKTHDVLEQKPHVSIANDKETAPNQPKSHDVPKQECNATIGNNIEVVKNSSAQQPNSNSAPNINCDEAASQSDAKRLPKPNEPAKKQQSTSGPSINDHLQDNKPLTPYEFGNLWCAIANNYDEYKALILSVNPKELPLLLSNKIDDHIIQTVAKVALEQVTSDNCQYAYDMLSHLTKAKRFGMATMFMGDSDKQFLRQAFQAMRKYDSVSKSEIESLEKKYDL